MDETVEEFCASIFRHEVMLISAQCGKLQLSRTEMELITRRIKRCEAWLTVLGRHVALARVHERVAHYRKNNLPLDSFHAPAPPPPRAAYTPKPFRRVPPQRATVGH